MKLTPASRKGVSNIGLTRVAVRLRSFSSSAFYQSQFLVDTGADPLAPTSELKKIGIKAIGKMAYELATGTFVEYEFGLAEIHERNDGRRNYLRS
jgi:predicted aspartyl protease